MSMVTTTTCEACDDELDEAWSDWHACTGAQAAQVKAANPATSPWWVVAAQLLLGLLASGLTWLVWGGLAAQSVLSGALAVVLPGALFAHGLTSQFARANVAAAVLSFFVWELVKIFLTIVLLFAAQRLVQGLNWLAMLAGFVLTVKVYWLALAFKRKPKMVQVINA